jgi:DNA-binding NarL/FixJ family response regulator
MINIAIAEDQVMVRESLVALINSQKDMHIQAGVSEAGEIISLHRDNPVDLALMDVITDNGSNGIVAAAELKKEFPAIKIIIMTGLPEITFVDAAKQAGVDSFIYKNVSSETLLSVIRSTMNGYRTYPGETNATKASAYAFTGREIEVLRLVCEAKGRKEIATQLAMSEGAVKAVITGILDKTGYDSILKFAIFAVSNGLITPGF